MAKYYRQLSRDVEICRKERCCEGYTLFAPSFQNTTAWLIDMAGNVVHYWDMKNPPGLNYQLLSNGNLMWMGRGPGALQKVNGSADELVEVDWEGNEVWRYDDPMMNHDFVVLKNGNIMVLRYVDLPPGLQERLIGGVPGTELNGKTYGVQIREIDRSGAAVWEWNNFDHFDPEKDIECTLCDREAWGYTNSLDVFPNGDVILSVRRMNKVIRIDKKTGKIIWEWGPEHLLGHQHDVSVCENGNYLICDSVAGTFYEVTADKEVVWKYLSPFILNIPNHFGWTTTRLMFQAHRYGKDFEAFKGKNLDPDRYEWRIGKIEQEMSEEEAKVRKRLEQAGY